MKPDWKDAPEFTAEQTGVGKLCAPGPADQQKQRYLVLFDDADMGISYFDDEQEARRFFVRAEGRGYNCYLFLLADRVTPASSPAALDLSGSPEGRRLTETCRRCNGHGHVKFGSQEGM